MAGMAEVAAMSGVAESGGWPRGGRARVEGERRLRTGRILLLAVLALFALAYGMPAFRLWQVNRRIEEVRRELEYSRLQQQELLKELERWNDPEVIARVAREKLGLVKPGEMRFVEALPVEPDDPFRVEKRPQTEMPQD